MSVFNGSIAFGLLSIPVKANCAARSESISFNLLHKECGTKISQKTWCTACAKEITRADTIKGFDEGNDTFLKVTAEDLAGAAPESSHVIEIGEIVNASEVDPLYFDASYYLEPDKAGRKGYKLLLEALKAEKKVAVAHVTLSQREHVVILRPYNGLLVFHTMFYAAEIRAIPTAANVSDVETVPAELALARQLLLANLAPFDVSQYSDGYQARIVKMLEAKRAGGEAPASAPKKPAAKPVDLMEALAASLKAKKKKAA
jgi:DNA end-binding protein Ku